jgi:acetyltransferase-like isoleucine patch superfamily enzyme
MMGFILYIISALLPWPLRRRLLEKYFGYTVHPTSRIGFSWVRPVRMILEAHTSIGHFTVCKGLDLLWLKEYSGIGKGNWVTGFPLGDYDHFSHQKERKPQLIIDVHSAITNRHIIDCTNAVHIGKFSTFAGFRSQILSHSIDLENCRQSSEPVTIGDYCFVGTDCVLLGGSNLPNYSVLGAKSLLNTNYQQEYHLYAGVPAKPVKSLSKDLGYFTRTTGFVI